MGLASGDAPYRRRSRSDRTVLTARAVLVLRLLGSGLIVAGLTGLGGDTGRVTFSVLGVIVIVFGVLLPRLEGDVEIGPGSLKVRLREDIADAIPRRSKPSAEATQFRASRPKRPDECRKGLARGGRVPEQDRLLVDPRPARLTCRPPRSHPRSSPAVLSTAEAGAGMAACRRILPSVAADAYPPTVWRRSILTFTSQPQP
jgi:hypothetical protein